MTNSALLGLACGIAAVFLLMTGLWFRQRRTHNAGIVDCGWVLSIGVMAFCAVVSSPGAPLRRWVLGAMAGAWTLRLFWHLAARYLRDKREDPRYHQMRVEKGAAADAFFFGVFWFQAAVAVVLSTPFWAACADPRLPLGFWEILGVALWTAGLVGESVADAQLARFKSRVADRCQVCREGLWKYSRHPNYFFECLIWVGFGLYAAPSPWGLWAWVSPALMIYFIVAFSGVPPAEKQSLLSKGQAYREYQRTTSVLVPWFPRKAS